jgi:beta-N-acetylhexosaminidase
MAENNRDDNHQYDWLYDGSKQPVPPDEADHDTAPLPIGNWQESPMRKHRFLKTVAVMAIVAGLGLGAVKGYDYWQDGGSLPNTPPPQASTTPTPHQPTQAECIAKLPLGLKLGQMIMMSANAENIAQISATAAKYNIGGVILMGPVPSAAQVKRFTAAQQLPPLVSTDQEGGTIQRYKQNILPAAADVPGSSLTDLRDLLAKDDRYLRTEGINMNFAPVVDVNPVGGTSVLGSRIFSDNPTVVAQDAEVYVGTSVNAGILPTLKHFPGLGTASRNTDYGDATTAPFSSLQQRDLLPYRHLVSARVAVMVGNQIVPGLTAGLPASLSKAAITDLLRGTLGYTDNVVITDSLSAKAILDHYSLAGAAVRSWIAGSDIALFVLPEPGLTAQQQVARMISQAKSSVKAGQLTEIEVNASVARIWALPQKHIDACSLPPNTAQ